MRRALFLPTAFALGVLAGCMAGGMPAPAAPPGPPAPSGRAAASTTLPSPLIIDRTDLRIGTTVTFTHLPTISELHDLRVLPGLAHIVLALDTWPGGYTPAIGALNTSPEEPDLIIVVAGYPPTRAAAEAWNYLTGRVRLLIVVDAPPPSSTVINDLNAMRYLERVIARMDNPSRSGFELLQRPLSFLKVMD